MFAVVAVAVGWCLKVICGVVDGVSTTVALVLSCSVFPATRTLVRSVVHKRLILLWVFQKFQKFQNCED